MPVAQAYLEHGDTSSLFTLCRRAGGKNALPVFHNICCLGALLRNDDSAAQRELAWAHGNPEESLLLNAAASAASAHGRLQEAERLFSQARANAETNKIPEQGISITHFVRADEIRSRLLSGRSLPRQQAVRPSRQEL